MSNASEIFQVMDASRLLNLCCTINENHSDKENVAGESPNLGDETLKSSARRLDIDVLVRLLQAERYLVHPSNQFHDCRQRLLQLIHLSLRRSEASLAIRRVSAEDIFAAFAACEDSLAAELALLAAPLRRRLAEVEQARVYLHKSRALEQALPALQAGAQRERSQLALEALVQRLSELEETDRVTLPLKVQTFRQAAHLYPDFGLLRGLGCEVEFSEMRRMRSGNLLVAFEAAVTAAKVAMDSFEDRLPVLDRKNFPELISRLGELRKRFNAAYRSFN